MASGNINETIPLTVKFPSDKAGLTTVGYTLKNLNGTIDTVRTVVGVTGIGNGFYATSITKATAWNGIVEWDTGEATPIYAYEEISIGDRLDTAVSSRLSAFGYTAPDNTGIAAIKTKTDNLPVDPASTSDIPTAATIADAVWDESMADHLAIGSTGQKLNAAGSVADPLTNIVPGNYISGTAGYILGTLTSGQITVVSPVSKDGGTITLYRGDDYFAVDGRALEWTDTGALWPDLTGATVNFKAGALTKACTVVTATGANKKVRVELFKADIDKLPEPYYTFDIDATLANGHIVTLVTGKLYIK